MVKVLIAPGRAATRSNGAPPLNASSACVARLVKIDRAASRADLMPESVSFVVTSPTMIGSMTGITNVPSRLMAVGFVSVIIVPLSPRCLNLALWPNFLHFRLNQPKVCWFGCLSVQDLGLTVPCGLLGWLCVLALLWFRLSW